MTASEKVGQDQIHALLFEDKLSWQTIIYDLINSEQLDPWNIDISLLANKYLEKVRALEETNFFVSSKVLLAASLLLRIKSEIVLSQDIPTLDDILFGKEDEKKPYVQERIDFDENVPFLVPRTPLPRFRRVTLEELMSALGKAIKTETRRIRKEVLFLAQEKETGIAMPKFTINLQARIQAVYGRITAMMEGNDGKLAFTHLLEEGNREDKLATFVSLLHLDNQQKVWLEQESHFEEIYIWLKHLYELRYKDELEFKRKEVEAFMAEASKGVEESEQALAVDAEDEELETV